MQASVFSLLEVIYSVAAGGGELLNMGANNQENNYYDTYLGTQLNE